MELESLRWRSALLEGIGVLVGILVAFGIDAAWDRRGDREREAVYLEALQAEIATNRARFEDHGEFLRWTLQEDEKALRTVVGGRELRDHRVQYRRAYGWGWATLEQARAMRGSILHGFGDAVSAASAACPQGPGERQRTGRPQARRRGRRARREWSSRGR